jgi:hypothetical protein
VDNNDYVTSDDPGPYEYITPTIHSIEGYGTDSITLSASDGGSGLGSNARWPWKYSNMNSNLSDLPALVQVRYSDGTFGQVKKYSINTSWNPPPGETIVFVRVADVDHNWSGGNEALDEPEGPPTAPQGLIILD